MGEDGNVFYRDLFASLCFIFRRGAGVQTPIPLLRRDDVRLFLYHRKEKGLDRSNVAKLYMDSFNNWLESKKTQEFSEEEIKPLDER